MSEGGREGGEERERGERGRVGWRVCLWLALVPFVQQICAIFERIVLFTMCAEEHGALCIHTLDQSFFMG